MSTEQQTEASALQWKAILSSPGPSPSPRPCGVVQHDQGEGHQQPITFRLLGEGVRVYFLFGCEDAAQQVLMSSVRLSVCLSESQVEILSQCAQFQNVPECMQNVPECSRMHAECSRMFQNVCRMYAECSGMF